MGRKLVEQILKEVVDGKAILGGSLLRMDGTVVASYYKEISDTTANLMARDSLSGKRRRRIVFPVLGKLIASVATYDKMHLGLSLIGEDQYLHLIGDSSAPLPTFYVKLQEISNKLRTICV